MSKLLTLGQLIDTMKIGDIAKSDGKVTDIIGYHFVKREEKGFISWNGQDEDDTHNLHHMKLERRFTLFEWEILPRYVSFEKAIELLLIDGNMINSYIDGNFFDAYESVYDLHKLEKHEIEDMKWVVIKK